MSQTSKQEQLFTPSQLRDLRHALDDKSTALLVDSTNGTGAGALVISESGRFTICTLKGLMDMSPDDDYAKGRLNGFFPQPEYPMPTAQLDNTVLFELQTNSLVFVEKTGAELPYRRMHTTQLSKIVK